jgi:hypothetical protein
MAAPEPKPHKAKGIVTRKADNCFYNVKPKGLGGGGVSVSYLQDAN